MRDYVCTPDNLLSEQFSVEASHGLAWESFDCAVCVDA